jgi:hypothetical protein
MAREKVFDSLNAQPVPCNMGKRKIHMVSDVNFCNVRLILSHEIKFDNLFYSKN